MPNFTLPDSIFETAADKFPTPFHLYDEAGLRQNARDLNAAFSWCRDFKEYFAVKALPNPAILRILKEDGSVQMIRRAETPKDYFATFDFCDILKNVKNV